MTHCLRFAAALALLPIAGCSLSAAPAEPIAQTIEHLEVGNLPADADLAAPPDSTISFDPSWQENVQGTVYGGARVAIVASPDRFPVCGATGTVTAFVRIDGAGPQALAMTADPSGWTRATLQLPPEAANLELWLHAENANGCSEWDSNLEKNYRVAVHGWQPSIVHFRGDWSERADFPVLAGGVLAVDYDPARLPDCRATDQYGVPAWDIVGHVRFSNGLQIDHSVTYPVTSSGVVFARERGLTLFPVPKDAVGVQLWFENTQQQLPYPTTGTCPSWDSDFERNYPFAIVPPKGAAPQVGWAGEYDFIQYHREPAIHQGDVDPVYYFDQMAGAELSTWQEVQVYVPGVTDVAYGSKQEEASAAKARITAQAVTDGLTGPVNGWGTSELAFERKQGNNFVYSFRFWQLRSSMYQNPPMAEGLHQYYFRFSTDAGASWFEAGRANGHGRRMVVAAQQDCSLFPDHAPQGCPAARGVGWAGSWGGLFSHACEYRAGVPDPIVFTKSALGHDCMSLMAEVWIPGLTDAGTDPSQILAQVETDIGFQGGPLSPTATYPLTFDGRTGNNYRYRWDTSENVGRADRGDYTYRFRFSADQGVTWYTIGTDEGPSGGGWRGLRVRNDSNDIDTVKTCDGIESWQGATNVFPTCVQYAIDHNYDANTCEFWVNAFGRGGFSSNGASASWIEAWLKTGALEGEILNAGMLTNYLDANGVAGARYSLGQQTEPGYWSTGFTYAASQMGSNAFAFQPQSFAFFLDVRRPDSTIVRLWMSNGSKNYTPGEVFAVPGQVQGGGVTSVEYADGSAKLFDQKRACE